MKSLIFAAPLWLASAAALAAGPFVPELPQGAMVSAQASNPATSLALATGPWRPEGAERRMLEGARSDTAWRLRANQMTTLQLLASLRQQIAAEGYSILYECETDACGGFDFRYALDLLPEPQMHVDLADFRYLAARKGADYLALTVSRSSESGFIHLTEMTAQAITTAEPENPLTPTQPTPTEAPKEGIGATLEAAGRAVLEDLAFESGKSALEGEDFPSLAALADYLSTRPEARVTLVGHTDAVGALGPNVAISKARAEAVRARLIERYGVSAKQLTAEGAGWLAPRATNLTEEGRTQNRRVEAVLTSTRS